MSQKNSSNDNLSDEELASAWIDGELGDDAMQQVSQRMESDPDFARLVSLLSEQSQLFKSLPVYRPSTGFADRVVDSSISQVKAIVGGDSLTAAFDDPGARSAFAPDAAASIREARFQSRVLTAVSIFSSLAALLMLGLFIFQGLGQADSQIAQVDRSEAETTLGTDLAKSVEGRKEVLAETDALATGQPSPVSAFLVPEEIMAESLGQQSFGEPAIDSELAVADSLKKGLDGVLAEPESAAVRDSEMAPVRGGLRGMPMQVSDDGAAEPVEQVWLVEMNRAPQSMASFSQTLVDNRIQVQLGDTSLNQQVAVLDRLARSKAKDYADRDRLGSTSAADKSDGEDDDETDADEFFGDAEASDAVADQSTIDAPGVEAFFVSATPAQMRQALVDLSSQAAISTFQVPGNSTDAAPVTGQDSYSLSTNGVSNRSTRRGGEQLDSLAIPRNGTALAQQMVRRNLPAPVVDVPPVPGPGKPEIEGFGFGGAGRAMEPTADRKLAEKLDASQSAKEQSDRQLAAAASRPAASLGLMRNEEAELDDKVLDGRAAERLSEIAVATEPSTDDEMDELFGVNESPAGTAEPMRRYLIMVKTE